ncbi:MAG: hypothetical protein ACI4PC_01880 [Oscillospiraceae bacterium]
MKRNKILYAFAAALLVLALCLTGCGPDSAGSTDSSSQEATPTPAATPVITPDPTPEATPEPTPEPPAVTPPAATPNPASGSDIEYQQTRPSTDTDIPEE